MIQGVGGGHAVIRRVDLHGTTDVVLDSGRVCFFIICCVVRSVVTPEFLREPRS